MHHKGIVRFCSTDGDENHYVERHSRCTLNNHLFSHGSKVRWIQVQPLSVEGTLQYTDVSCWCHLTLWPAQCFRALISSWPHLLPRHPLHPARPRWPEWWGHMPVDISSHHSSLPLFACLWLVDQSCGHINLNDDRTFILNSSTAFNFFFFYEIFIIWGIWTGNWHIFATTYHYEMLLEPEVGDSSLHDLTGVRLKL